MMSLFNNPRIPHVFYSLLILASAAMLQGCPLDDDETPPAAKDPAPTYSIGGTVSGLTGTLVLQNNGADDLTITKDGDFTISTGLADGAAYAVTVSSHPTSQVCGVSNGSGNLSGANITGISVVCAAQQEAANGIYTGSAELNTEPKAIPTDLKGMAYDNRLYVFSASENVLYSVTIGSITGNDISGTAVVYVNGVVHDSGVTMTGYVVPESQLVIELGGSLQAGGTLTLTYNEIFKRGATHPRIYAQIGRLWDGNGYSVSNDAIQFEFNHDAQIVNGWSVQDPPNCDFSDNGYADSFYIPNAENNIYKLFDFEINQSTGDVCNYVGISFEGYASVVDRTGTDDELWFVLANGTNSVFGILNH